MDNENIITYKTSIPSNEKALNLSVIFTSPQNPAALVQIVHGMCEHKERYTHFIEYLVNNGFACVIHDNRGHGDSVINDDDLGYFYETKKDGFMDDISRVGEFGTFCYNIIKKINFNNEKIDSEELERRFSEFDYSLNLNEIFKAESNEDDFSETYEPELKRHLFGHSMGSLAVRAYAAENDDELLSLTVCGSPSRNIAAGFGIFLAELIGFFRGEKYRSKLIKKLTIESFEQKFLHENDLSAWMSSNKEYRDAYMDKRKCDFNFTANGYSTLFKLMKDTYSPAKWDVNNKNLPIMFISGSDDPCAKGEKHFNDAVQFIKDMGYINVTSKMYPKMRHEVLNETNRETVYDDIIQFLKKAQNET